MSTLCCKLIAGLAPGLQSKKKSSDRALSEVTFPKVVPAVLHLRRIHTACRYGDSLAIPRRSGAFLDRLGSYALYRQSNHIIITHDAPSRATPGTLPLPPSTRRSRSRNNAPSILKPPPPLPLTGGREDPQGQVESPSCGSS